MRPFTALTSLFRRHLATALTFVALALATPLALAATYHGVRATGHATSAASSTSLFTVNSQWSVTARNARLSAINTAAGTGFIDFYSGAQPANGDATVTGTQLCSIALGASPFNTPSAGSMTNTATVTCTGTAGATGTGTAAGYVVLYKSDHTTVLWMGSVGTSSANITLPSTTITTGETVSIASGALTLSDNASISGQ